MNVYEAMTARKTIRDFTPEEVSPQTIKKIISAGMLAPTNDHMRRWHFVVLQDRAKRKELLDRVINPVDEQGAVKIVDDWGLIDPDQRFAYIDAIPKQYAMLYNCGALILPFFEQSYPLLKPESLSSLNGLASIWCCVENMLVAAAAEGIFGVTRIPFEEERYIIKQTLCVPPYYETPCWLALGYPAENAKRARQVQIDLDERIHVNGW
jgi:nitroreductase